MTSLEEATEKMRRLIAGLVGRQIQTRGPSPNPNEVVAITGDVVEIHTARSKREGTRPTIPLGWFAEAWQVLKRDGYLERKNLPHPMRHRSAAVFAILAQHACVDDVTERTIRLELDRGCAEQRSTLKP